MHIIYVSALTQSSERMKRPRVCEMALACKLHTWSYGLLCRDTFGSMKEADEDFLGVAQNFISVCTPEHIQVSPERCEQYFLTSHLPPYIFPLPCPHCSFSLFASTFSSPILMQILVMACKLLPIANRAFTQGMKPILKHMSCNRVCPTIHLFWIW